MVDSTFQWGKGVEDQLIDAGFSVFPVNYAAPASNPRFKNTRCEMWWNGAEAIKNGACLPLMPELVPELTEITYMFSEGQFQLEPKELFKGRLGYSPDLADAYMQTYVIADMAGDLATRLGLPGRAQVLRARDAYERDDAIDNTPVLRDRDPFG